MTLETPVEPNTHAAIAAIDRKCILILQALLAQQDLLESLAVQKKSKLIT
jgi:hypothetical protein